MAHIVLPPVLDLTAAATLKQALLDALLAGDVVVHAQNVERIGTPALQLLVAAVVAGARIAEASAALCNTASILGLSTALKLEEFHV